MITYQFIKYWVMMKMLCDFYQIWWQKISRMLLLWCIGWFSTKLGEVLLFTKKETYENSNACCSNTMRTIRLNHRYTPETPDSLYRPCNGVAMRRHSSAMGLNWGGGLRVFANHTRKANSNEIPAGSSRAAQRFMRVLSSRPCRSTCR